MRKNILLTVILFVLCFCLLAGCDSQYPLGKMKLEKLQTISKGDSVDVSIIYPNTGGTIVLGWKNQNIEILSGEDIISVSGLSITGMKSGTALVKVNATTDISDEMKAAGNKEKVYSIETKITVK